MFSLPHAAIAKTWVHERAVISRLKSLATIHLQLAKYFLAAVVQSAIAKTWVYRRAVTSRLNSLATIHLQFENCFLAALGVWTVDPHH